MSKETPTPPQWSTTKPEVTEPCIIMLADFWKYFDEWAFDIVEVSPDKPKIRDADLYFLIPKIK